MREPKVLYVLYQGRREVICDECLKDLDISIRGTDGLLTKQVIDSYLEEIDGETRPALRPECAQCGAEFSYESLPEGSSCPR